MTIHKTADVTDTEILMAVSALQNFALTRIIAAQLRLSTNRTRRRLSQLEREARIERTPSNYARQICWRQTEE